ncbi:spike base protein, RCAP_Rcc01079 family [Polymorphum gilvum]|uniref:Uncharacterized protein n=1 Tax=Polymorphum gilvum (strain LMG 25793 / CGMCC 1.9160 / SL003B-26A1) TaxID=991905 RepID=F2IW58_POLGS|nr:hypothetical protein [Polymorphum gilvum]ADZ71443.1 hypothetical protein SL003B_3020 [Polymorphum gilvum SL003B-26A1]
MTDPHTRATGLDSPPARLFQIGPDDDADLAVTTRGLMVGTAGDVRVTTLAGDTAVLPALVPGVQYAIRARRVHATGTTATQIVGLA